MPATRSETVPTWPEVWQSARPGGGQSDSGTHGGLSTKGWRRPWSLAEDWLSLPDTGATCIVDLCSHCHPPFSKHLPRSLPGRANLLFRVHLTQKGFLATQFGSGTSVVAHSPLGLSHPSSDYAIS